MRRAVVAAVAVLVVAGAGFGVHALLAGRHDPRDDVRTVYCLSDEHRKEVAQAAVRLGLAEEVPRRPQELAVGPRGRRENLTLEEWRERDPKGFERACSALIAANGESPLADAQGSDGLRDGLLIAAVTAVFTLVIQALEGGRIHRRQRLETLADTVNAYTAAAGRYLNAWVLNPDTSHETVALRRADLVSALRMLNARGERRREARRLAAALPLAEPLSPFQADGGQPLRLDSQARKTIAADLREDVERAGRAAGRLTKAPVRWYWHNWRSATRGGRAGSEEGDR